MTIAIRRMIKAALFTSCWLISAVHAAPQLFKPSTVFDLEVIANPQISPDGTKVLYERRGFDIMTDRATKALWLYDLTTEVHEPVLAGGASFGSVAWSSQSDYVAVAVRGTSRSMINVVRLEGRLTATVATVSSMPSQFCLLYTSPSPRDGLLSRMPSSA